jgi:hypothetical protein
MAARTVTIGGENLKVEEFTGRKGVWALKLLQQILNAVPKIQAQLAEFLRTYGEEHAIELSRSEAKKLFGSSLDHLTEDDWEKSGQVLRRRAMPSVPEQIAAVFPLAMDEGEEHVVKLLALLVTPNNEVKRLARSGGLLEHLTATGDDLLDDGMLEELLELAVVAGETLDEQLLSKTQELGDRLGKLKALLRKNSAATSNATSSTTSAISSSDSPTPTGGESDELSTAPAGGSSLASSTA